MTHSYQPLAKSMFRTELESILDANEISYTFTQEKID